MLGGVMVKAFLPCILFTRTQQLNNVKQDEIITDLPYQELILKKGATWLKLPKMSETDMQKKVSWDPGTQEIFLKLNPD